MVIFIQKGELKQQIDNKDQIIAQMTAAHNQALADKNQIIADKDRIIAIQDQLSHELKMELRERIITLSTELAFKSGFLNNRGIIEQFEYR